MCCCSEVQGGDPEGAGRFPATAWGAQSGSGHTHPGSREGEVEGSCSDSRTLSKTQGNDSVECHKLVVKRIKQYLV